MSDLRKLMPEDNSIQIPEDAIWNCIDCDWRGLVSECPTEPEPIGFVEGPWYDMPICPECGGGVEV